MRPTSVLFVSHSADLRGGADKWLFDVVTRLNRTQFRPVVLVPKQGTMADRLAAADFDVVFGSHKTWLDQRYRPLRAAARLLFNFYSAHAWVRAHRELEIDVVYSNTLYTPFGALLAKAAQRPHIWHIHEHVRQGLEMIFDWGEVLSMRFVERTSEQVICSSKALSDHLRRFIPDTKLSVVYNGVEGEGAPRLPRSARVNAETLHLCLVGSLNPVKGQDQAIRAVAELVHSGRDVVLHLIGEGSYEVELRELAATLSVTERVYFHGFADPNPIYAMCDINLVCSRFEGFGRTIIEAMAAGCPTVGANSGGVTDVIEDEISGLLYIPGSTDSLKACICRLVDDQNLYAQISNNGMLTSHERFSLSRVLESTQHKIIRSVTLASSKL